MASVNKVILIGRLGADPELRETTRGAKVANMSLATNQQWVDQQSGESRRRTELHRAVVGGRRLRRRALGGAPGGRPCCGGRGGAEV